MTTRRFFLGMMFAGLPTAAALASGKKQTQTDIGFHLQAEEGDNEKMTFTQLTAGKQLTFKRMTEVNQKDIANFEPFQSSDGDGYGIQLKLKPGAEIRINALTTANQGRWLLAMVNGRVVDAVLIDKPVNDGILVIWKGVSEAEVHEMDKTIPRFGQSKPNGDVKKKKD